MEFTLRRLLEKCPVVMISNQIVHDREVSPDDQTVTLTSAPHSWDLKLDQQVSVLNDGSTKLWCAKSSMQDAPYTVEAQFLMTKPVELEDLKEPADDFMIQKVTLRVAYRPQALSEPLDWQWDSMVRKAFSSGHAFVLGTGAEIEMEPDGADRAAINRRAESEQIVKGRA